MRSYHPISLLNKDYKIFSALIAKRLNKIITSYIHPDQSGFMPHRDIMDNVYRMLEKIHLGKANLYEPSIIILLDIENAFNRLEHNFLLSLVNHMNFGPRFPTVIHTIYTAPSALVKVNCQSSATFPISRGTRQGCPLSPLLFVLAIEPLAEALRSLGSFCGIQVGDKIHKLSRFADDMALHITNLVQSLCSIETILQVFQTVSGLTVNKDKSVIYLIVLWGSRENELLHHFLYPVIRDYCRYLGVEIPMNFMNFPKLNLTETDNSIRDTLKIWDDKHLSWFE